jgi:diguanylate cyclase
VKGFEALVRWQHPQRGLLEPAAFIDIAEETGSIHELGAWVLEEACRQTVIWNAARPDAAPLRISVNLSARQMTRPALAGLVESVLDRYGIAPAQLALELTETVLIEQTRQSTATLCALDELGVQLVLDDFGTGYSSLSHLKRFPLSELKLDRSYVAGLGSDTGDTAIVGAVLGIARVLGMSVTAEGIETAEQVAALQALGCPLGQGFHFARPLPAAEATRVLEMPALWLKGFAPARD